VWVAFTNRRDEMRGVKHIDRKPGISSVGVVGSFSISRSSALQILKAPNSLCEIREGNSGTEAVFMEDLRRPRPSSILYKLGLLPHQQKFKRPSCAQGARESINQSMFGVHAS
jgi:hypothetical protein